MKKFFLILLCIIIASSMLLSASANEVTWNITNGLLTISGSGAMQDFASESDAPWYNERLTIEKIVVEDGITHIGDFAFYGMTNAKTLTIADSVKSIGINALNYTKGTVTKITNANAPVTFSVKSENQISKAGNEIYITIDIHSDLKTLSEISGTLVFDSSRFSAVGNENVQLISNTIKFSNTYNGDNFPYTIAKLKFKSLADINNINITCFNLKNCKVTLKDDSVATIEPSIIQLTSSDILPLENIELITNSQIVKEYATKNGIKIDTLESTDEITVLIDGKKIEFDVKPMLINDRTLVPMRAIFENLGALVQWDDKTQTAFGTDGNILIAFQIDNTLMTKSKLNGENEKIILDVPAKLINDRTLVPIRAISEAFDCKVDWVDETKTVVITTNK